MTKAEEIAAQRAVMALLAAGCLACSGTIEGPPDADGRGAGDRPGDVPAGPGAAGDDLPIDPATGLPIDPADGPGARAEVSHPEPALRRLTREQYQASVRDLIGVELDIATLTAVPPLNGMRAVGASSITFGERDLERFGQLAEQAVTGLFADEAARLALVGCEAADAGCTESFVRDFGRRVLRRPLTQTEQDRYLSLSELARERTGDAWLGLSFVAQALLQSPHFLYRVELGEPDPAEPARRVLGDHELATRLSFFLWGSTPDDALLDAADSGALADPAGLVEQARRLLESPRAAVAVEQFYRDYLQLDGLDALDKNVDVFPQLTDTLGPAMAGEMVQTLRQLTFEQGADFRDLFTTRTTFVNDELARLYGLPEPGSEDLVEVQLPDDGPRAGLLTQAGFLAAHSHPTRSSPTLRGKFIRETLLCQGIPPPPPDVDTTLPDTSMAATMRERLRIHRENPACAGCHSLTDPIGLGLENFDALGVYRSEENGVTIDASGDLDGVDFADARELGVAIGEHPNLPASVTRKLLGYARGQLADASEAELIDGLAQAFVDDGHAVPALMLAVITSDMFRYAGEMR